MTDLRFNIAFQGNDGSTGNETWKTDGTSAWTLLIKDIRVGSSGSNPGNFVVMGSYVYCTAEFCPLTYLLFGYNNGRISFCRTNLDILCISAAKW